MGIYSDRVVPRLVNVMCGAKLAEPLRQRVCEGLQGDVVEIGFGSGHNVRHYPATLTGVTAVEPSDVAWRLATDRLAEARVPVLRSGLDGQALPFEDQIFDSALSTWTLCTIPDAVAALRELKRVLKPGGSFHFVEHGLAPDEPVRRWQRRLEPVQRRVAGGCHLTRPIADLITTAGFTITDLDVFYQPGAPKFLGALTLGTANTPGAASPTDPH
ncbi:class I SAM-dependent methyltransferase [Kribbella catacumbae]|uniref:class I SAM-dependent methyltransferase n=1 Tax=Kribbella catacumbae TaxID=460086 RepID=UPI000362DDC4|nr:class I SAM-dependent methyltransferase [Kribbella catacumbae]